MVDTLLALLELNLPKQVDIHLAPAENIFTELISNYYDSKGVYNDPTTFHKAVGCNYHSFWGYATKELGSSKTLKQKV